MRLKEFLLKNPDMDLFWFTSLQLWTVVERNQGHMGVVGGKGNKLFSIMARAGKAALFQIKVMAEAIGPLLSPHLNKVNR